VVADPVVADRVVSDGEVSMGGLRALRTVRPVECRVGSSYEARGEGRIIP
jgi:hypothetical protein